MAEKAVAYAQIEALAGEMKLNPKLHFWAGQGAYSASAGTQTLDLSKLFPFPRTLVREVSAIDEGSYTGWASGMAASGLPAITRFPAMAQLISFEYIYNNIAKLGYMTGRQATQPLVLWVSGGSRSEGSGGQHVEVGNETLFSWIAGLKVTCHSNAYDAKGLLITALRSGDPVIYMDYGGTAAEVPDDQYEIPFGQAAVRQEGTDVTLVAWGEAVGVVEAALPLCKEAGISVEYIDPRTLKPLDVATLAASAKKTGKLLTVEHGWYTCGYGAHVVSEVAQAVPGTICKRITFPDVVGPHSKEMMDWLRPDPPNVVDAVKQMAKL